MSQSSRCSAPISEVSRGRSTLTDMPSFLPAGRGSATWLGRAIGGELCADPPTSFRCRLFFPACNIPFSNDGQNVMVETLVLHACAITKDLIQVSIEDSASAVTSSHAMLAFERLLLVECGLNGSASPQWHWLAAWLTEGAPAPEPKRF